MIERTPSLDAARSAAALHLADERLPGDAEPTLPSEQASSSTSHESAERSTTSTSSSSPNGSASKGIAASREQLIRMGAMLVLNGSVGAARRWGAHWVYSEQECLAVSEATLDVIEHYFGGVNHPVVNLGIVLGATAVPRIIGPKQPPLGATPATPPASSPPPTSSTGNATPGPAAAAEVKAAA